MRTHFTVKVPATTANLGSAYDAAGMALTLYNEFEFTIRGDDHVEVFIEGEGEELIPLDSSNLVIRSFLGGMRKAGIGPPGLTLRQLNRIPAARGLGSSATAALAGLLAAREVAGGYLKIEEMLNLAVDLEGHPDNILAAYYGGVVLTYPSLSIEGREDGSCGIHNWCGEKFLPGGDLSVVLAVPEILISTEEARKLLPDSYSRDDCIENLRNLSLLILGLKEGRFELLGRAMEDRIHQPYRKTLIPGFDECVKAAREAGAFSAAISGSGSTIAAFCSGNEEAIGEAMKSVFDEQSIPCRVFVTKVSPKGAVVE